MRSLLDFSSWQGILSTLSGLFMVTAIGVGIRLVVMQRVQERRERQNRQINVGQRLLRGDQPEVVTFADGSATADRGRRLSGRSTWGSAIRR